jgi:hypothetical protein
VNRADRPPRRMDNRQPEILTANLQNGSESSPRRDVARDCLRGREWTCDGGDVSRHAVRRLSGIIDGRWEAGIRGSTRCRDDTRSLVGCGGCRAGRRAAGSARSAPHPRTRSGARPSPGLRRCSPARPTRYAVRPGHADDACGQVSASAVVVSAAAGRRCRILMCSASSGIECEQSAPSPGGLDADWTATGLRAGRYVAGMPPRG